VPASPTVEYLLELFFDVACERDIFLVCGFFVNVEISSRFRYRSRDTTLQEPEIILLASIPDLFVAVDGNAGIESEFHSTHAIPRHVPIDGGVFGSFIPLGYPEVFPWRINQMYFRELPP